MIDERVPYTLYVKHDWAIFFLVNRELKQTSNVPWTNNIRHAVIICHLRLFKTRKIKNLVREFGLLHSCEMSEMREGKKTLILFVKCEKAKYFYVTEFYKGVLVRTFDNEKKQFKFLETFELSSLWFTNNHSH